MLKVLKTSQKNQIEYYYHRGPVGKSVLLLHSPGFNYSRLIPYIKELEKSGYTIVAPSLRCHGKSKKAPITRKGFISDIKEVMSAEKIDSYNIVSYCLSAPLAYALNQKEKQVFILPCSKKYMKRRVRTYVRIALLTYHLFLRKKKRSKKIPEMRWDKITTKNPITILKMIRKHMSFGDFLQTTRVLLQSPLILKESKKAMCILTKKDHILNNKKILRDYKGRVEWLFGNHDIASLEQKKCVEKTVQFLEE